MNCSNSGADEFKTRISTLDYSCDVLVIHAFIFICYYCFCTPLGLYAYFYLLSSDAVSDQSLSL